MPLGLETNFLEGIPEEERRLVAIEYLATLTKTSTKERYLQILEKNGFSKLEAEEILLEVRKEKSMRKTFGPMIPMEEAVALGQGIRRQNGRQNRHGALGKKNQMQGESEDTQLERRVVWESSQARRDRIIPTVGYIRRLSYAECCNTGIACFMVNGYRAGYRAAAAGIAPKVQKPHPLSGKEPNTPASPRKGVDDSLDLGSSAAAPSVAETCQEVIPIHGRNRLNPPEPTYEEQPSSPEGSDYTACFSPTPSEVEYGLDINKNPTPDENENLEPDEVGAEVVILNRKDALIDDERFLDSIGDSVFAFLIGFGRKMSKQDPRWPNFVFSERNEDSFRKFCILLPDFVIAAIAEFIKTSKNHAEVEKAFQAVRMALESENFRWSSLDSDIFTTHLSELLKFFQEKTIARMRLFEPFQDKSSFVSRSLDPETWLKFLVHVLFPKLKKMKNEDLQNFCIHEIAVEDFLEPLLEHAALVEDESKEEILTLAAKLIIIVENLGSTANLQCKDRLSLLLKLFELKNRKSSSRVQGRSLLEHLRVRGEFPSPKKLQDVLSLTIRSEVNKGLAQVVVERFVEKAKQEKLAKGEMILSQESHDAVFRELEISEDVRNLTRKPEPVTDADDEWTTCYVFDIVELEEKPDAFSTKGNDGFWKNGDGGYGRKRLRLGGDHLRMTGFGGRIFDEMFEDIPLEKRFKTENNDAEKGDCSDSGLDEETSAPAFYAETQQDNESHE